MSLDFLEAAFRLRENIELPLIEEEFRIDIGDFNRDVNDHINEGMDSGDLS